MSTAGEATPVLDLRDVGRTYDDGYPVHAVRTTSLSLFAGDYVTITGPSGSGKSTLLNILGLLDRPTEGTYRVHGLETSDATESTRSAIRGQMFGFVFQAFHLLAGRSALENVELGMLYRSRRPSLRRQSATEALIRVGVQHRASVDPRILSGGERQRVAIARAIAGRPSVLLCDEPTGNLDQENSLNVLGLLEELNADGLTVVVVTHDANLVSSRGRRVTVDDGIVREIS